MAERNEAQISLRLEHAKKLLHEWVQKEPIVSAVKDYATHGGMTDQEWPVMAVVHLCEALANTKKEVLRYMLLHPNPIVLHKPVRGAALFQQPEEKPLKQAILAALRELFMVHAESFSELPNSSNWLELERSMWALQCAKQKTEEELSRILDMAPIDKWEEKLEAFAKQKAVS